MTPAAFSAALATLGWSQRHLAVLLRCDTNLPNRWAGGRSEVPPGLAVWLATLASFVRNNPPPVDWRKR